MKFNLPLIFTATATLLFFPIQNYAQAPDLGRAAGFVLFTVTGAVGNTGISLITGNVGTNTGAITGFGNVNGGMHNTNATTAQSAADLLIAYNQLNSMVPTSPHIPVLGNGEILTGGIYSIAAAASIVGSLTLDAQGDTNSVFIIMTGGALTTAASSTVSLINGASACNVFWKVEGAASMAAGTTMRGNIIANNGAIHLGAGCILEGRALSTTGSVTVYGTLAYLPLGCGIPPLTGPNFPDLACAACYAIFSGSGAVTNVGVTHVTGDIGTHSGLLTGFNSSYITGNLHRGPNPTTAQIASDILKAYHKLDTLPYDIELLYPAQFGHNLVLTPHTYLMNAAAALTDTVYLNAQGNANAVFVIKINGAFSTSTYAKVKLMNGAQAKNVFWKVEGAVTINDYSIFTGNIIANNGAIILNTGVNLFGRACTTTGAISTSAITASIIPSECLCYVLPNKLLSFTGVCTKQYALLTWSTATEVNSNIFAVERSIEGINWKPIGMVAGSGNSSNKKIYTYTDSTAIEPVYYYRLKQIDLSGDYKYGNVIVIKKCGTDVAENVTIYPNPSNGKFDVLTSAGSQKIYSTKIFNSSGVKIYETNNTQSHFNLSGKSAGIYFVQINQLSKIITLKMMMQN